MRCLIACYSLSGTTRRIAELAAKELGADLVEIRAARYRPGAFGFMRAGYDAWRGNLPLIGLIGAASAAESYDLVLVMGPVWAGHAATPVQAYLQRTKGKLRRVGFVLTCGGPLQPRTFEEMASRCGAKPEAAIALTQKDIQSSAGLPPALSSYLASLSRRAAGRAALN